MIAAFDVVDRDVGIFAILLLTASGFVLLSLWIFLAIRRFRCWYWKTTAITEQIEIANEQIDDLQLICYECQMELVKANAFLQRIAEGTTVHPVAVPVIPEGNGNHPVA